jgi:hypothetical protein
MDGALSTQDEARIDVTPAVRSATEAVTLETLAEKLDVIGQQLNWLTENLQSLFLFVNQVSSSGGGIRGLMHAMRQAPPNLTPQEPERTNDE